MGIGEGRKNRAWVARPRRHLVLERSLALAQSRDAQGLKVILQSRPRAVLLARVALGLDRRQGLVVQRAHVLPHGRLLRRRPVDGHLHPDGVLARPRDQRQLGRATLVRHVAEGLRVRRRPPASGRVGADESSRGLLIDRGGDRALRRAAASSHRRVGRCGAYRRRLARRARALVGWLSADLQRLAPRPRLRRSAAAGAAPA